MTVHDAQAGAAVAADPALSQPQSWWISLGLGVSAVSATASSFDGLRSLAAAVGWSSWLAPALPATIDALSITATVVWITGAASLRVRRFARTCALLAILMSIGGNACWHLHAAGLLELNFAVVLGVGTVPPIVLGLCSHLAALRRLSTSATAKTDGDSRPSLGDGMSVPKNRRDQAAVPAPRPRVLREDELLDAARVADEEFRARFGQSITRDLLRTTLGIGGQKATELLRRLRAGEPPAAPKPKKTVTAKRAKP